MTQSNTSFQRGSGITGVQRGKMSILLSAEQKQIGGT